MRPGPDVSSRARAPRVAAASRAPRVAAASRPPPPGASAAGFATGRSRQARPFRRATAPDLRVGAGERSHVVGPLVLPEVFIPSTAQVASTSAYPDSALHVGHDAVAKSNLRNSIETPRCPHLGQRAGDAACRLLAHGRRAQFMATRPGRPGRAPRAGPPHSPRHRGSPARPAWWRARAPHCDRETARSGE